MKRLKFLLATALVAASLFADTAFATDVNEWSDVSHTDEFYVLRESLSLRRPSERYLVLEYRGVATGRPDGWAIRGITFPQTNPFTKAVSLRQLLYTDGETDSVMEIIEILENFDWTALDNIDAYGNMIEHGQRERDEFIICTDGSSLTLAHVTDRGVQEVSRHNCAGRTALDALVEALTPHLMDIDRQFGKDFIKPLTNIPARRRSDAVTDSPRP